MSQQGQPRSLPLRLPPPRLEDMQDPEGAARSWSWLVTNVEERFTNFGAAGTLVYGLLTVLVLPPSLETWSAPLPDERRTDGRRPARSSARCVQRVLLRARATLRLPRHPAPPNRGDPRPLRGRRRAPEAPLVRVHADRRCFRTGCRSGRPGARSRAPRRRAHGDGDRRPRRRRPVPRPRPLAVPRTRLGADTR